MCIALERVESRFHACISSGQESLIVIVGKGNHSKDNIRKIEPAVKELLIKLKLRVEKVTHT